MIDSNNQLKKLSASLLASVRDVMEAKKHTEPKSEKEKDLAAKAPPHDKITHADVLAGRGVLKQHPTSGKMVTKEDEQMDELSKNTMLKYLAANKKDDAKAKETGDYDKMTKRMRGTDMAVRKYTAKAGSKYVRVPATEEVEHIDEALDAAARYGQHHVAIKELMKSISQHVDAHKADALKHRDYRGKKGVHWGHVGDLAQVHSQLADIHDRLAQQGEYKKTMGESVEAEEVSLSDQEIAALDQISDTLEEGRGRPKLPRDAKGNIIRDGSKATTEEEEPKALGYQLRKAASMNKPVHFMNGEKKEVSQGHIDRFNDHMDARKSSQEKAAFQKQAHKSHADFVKAVSEKVPHKAKDTGEIVKYRH